MAKNPKSAKNRRATEPEDSSGILSRLGSLIKGDEGPKEEEDGPIKATGLLKKDHDTVRDLFKRYKEAEGAARAPIVDQVSRELTIHAQIEEEIFYPALQRSRENETVKMVRESFEEHKIVKTLIRELAETSPKDPQFDAKFTVLRENVEHHADEEEDNLFPDAEKELGHERMLALGAELQDRKEELKEELEGSGRARARSQRTPARGSGPRKASGRRSGSRGSGARARA
jgi:iron-sulfur cluster repair protein YtfE (RIC family)